jgi:hypothetical protein
MSPLSSWLKMNQARNQHEAHSKQSSLFIGGLFSPEDGGDMFLRRSCWLSPDYMDNQNAWENRQHNYIYILVLILINKTQVLYLSVSHFNRNTTCFDSIEPSSGDLHVIALLIIIYLLVSALKYIYSCVVGSLTHFDYQRYTTGCITLRLHGVMFQKNSSDVFLVHSRF